MSFYIAVLVVAFSVDWFKFALFRNVVGNKVSCDANVQNYVSLMFL